MAGEKRTRISKHEKAIAARIKASRIKRGVSQRQLASLLGMTAGYLSLIEAGKRGTPREVVAKAARVLGVPDYYLEHGIGQVVFVLTNEDEVVGASTSKPKADGWVKVAEAKGVGLRVQAVPLDDDEFMSLFAAEIAAEVPA